MELTREELIIVKCAIKVARATSTLFVADDPKAKDGLSKFMERSPALYDKITEYLKD